MSTLAHREHQGSLADMIDLLGAPWTFLRRVSGHPVRVEEFVREGSYVIRAELPGIDPGRDMDVTVADGILTISAERREEFAGKHHSEFRYGTFSRSVTLPAGADDEHIEAIYGRGILEVTVRLAGDNADRPARPITVRQNQHIQAT